MKKQPIAQTHKEVKPMLSPKPILIAVCCVVAIVIGAYLVGGLLYFDQSREDTLPGVITDKPGPTETKGHINDDVWHDETHDIQIDEQETPISAKPANIDTKQERPAEWDPELVFKIGDSKEIDLNYRPLTEEEQAEYDHLKATLEPEAYGNSKAQLMIAAIANIKEKHRPEVTKRIWDDLEADRISREEALKQVREFYEFFAD